MPRVESINALPTYGAMYVTISFEVIEIKNITYFSDGNSYFSKDVRRDREAMKSGAIYNAVKRKFPNRTVTPFNIQLLKYHYEYFLDEYEVIKDKNKYYQTYIDIDTRKRKRYVENRFIIEDTTVGDYKRIIPTKENKNNEV